MIRKITRSSNGSTDPVLAESGFHETWILLVKADTWSTMSVALQASLDGVTWFPATSVSGATTFTSSSAVLVSAGLYYRGVITNYSTAVTIEIRPT